MFKPLSLNDLQPLKHNTFIIVSLLSWHNFQTQSTLKRDIDEEMQSKITYALKNKHQPSKSLQLCMRRVGSAASHAARDALFACKSASRQGCNGAGHIPAGRPCLPTYLARSPAHQGNTDDKESHSFMSSHVL